MAVGEIKTGLKLARLIVNTLAEEKKASPGPSTSTGNQTTNIIRVFSSGNDGNNTKGSEDKFGVTSAACLAAARAGLAAAGYCARTYMSRQDGGQANAPDRAAPMDEITTEELYASETEETTTTHTDGTTTTKRTGKRRREKKVVRRQTRRGEAEGGAGMPQRVPEAEMRRIMAVALMGDA